MTSYPTSAAAIKGVLIWLTRYGYDWRDRQSTLRQGRSFYQTRRTGDVTKEWFVKPFRQLSGWEDFPNQVNYQRTGHSQVKTIRFLI